jgi:hypothetical protein
MIAEEILEKQTTIEWLPVSEIGVDMTYQRTLSPDKVKLISTKFNEIAAGIIIVSLRDDGTTVALDGQHRKEAMKKRGILLAQCKVCRGLTVEQEAQIFIYCNTARKNPDALDTFRARLVNNDPVALAISTVVQECGLYISFYRGTRPQHSIWAVAALENIYAKGGIDLVKEILSLALRSWPDEPYAVEAKVLLGITNFYLQYGKRYIREEFIAKMNVTDLKSLLRRAQYHSENGGGGMPKTFAQALREAYDKGRRTRRLESK